VGGDGSMIIDTGIDTSGFEAGSEKLKSAIKSFGSNAKQAFGNIGKHTKGFLSSLKGIGSSFLGIGKNANSTMNRVTRVGKGVLGTIMKWGPALLGVGGAYQIISRAVSAFMSQNQRLSSQLSSCWTALGNVLGPIITKVVNWITTVVSYFLTFLRLLGVTNKSASQLSKAGNAAAGGANALKKSLLGFDELNLLQDNDTGGGGGGGMEGLKDFEPPEWMKDLANMLKKGEWDAAADLIIEKFNKLIDTFNSKAYEFGQKAGKVLGGALHMIARVIDETNWKGLGEGIAKFFNGLMEGVNGEDLGKILVGKITMAIKILGGFLAELKWDEVARILSEGLIGALNSLSKAISEVDWFKIGENLIKFIENVDWSGIIAALAKFVGSLVGALLSLIGPALLRLAEALRDGFSELADGTWEGFIEGISKAWSGIVEWFKTNIIDPFIEGVRAAFGIHSPSTVFIQIGIDIIQGLLDGLNTLWDLLTEWIDTLWENFTNTFTKLVNQVGTWALNLVSKFLGGIGTVWGSLNGWLNNVWSSFSSTFGNLISSALTWGQHIVQNLINGIRAKLSALRSIASEAGSIIKGLLGHSKPKEGPLRDDDQWGYHMTENFIEGIEKTLPKVKQAVTDLAESSKLEGLTDVVSGNFGSIASKIQDVASNVAFEKPSMAMGEVTPYSVNGTNGKTSTSGETEVSLADVVNSINSLKAFMNTLDDRDSTISLNVYLDGRQLEAAVTRRQERSLKAKGMA